LNGLITLCPAALVQATHALDSRAAGTIHATATAWPTALKIRQLPIADGNGQTALDGIGAIHKTIKKT
jgi:hypothetical protein